VREHRGYPGLHVHSARSAHQQLARRVAAHQRQVQQEVVRRRADVRNLHGRAGRRPQPARQGPLRPHDPLSPVHLRVAGRGAAVGRDHLDPQVQLPQSPGPDRLRRLVELLRSPQSLAAPDAACRAAVRHRQTARELHRRRPEHDRPQPRCPGPVSHRREPQHRRRHLAVADPRDRTYHGYETQDVGTALRELARVINGPT
jgi:hypothetical protein